ncbi:hypothetical protein SDC9_25211 [bioreactor metagenome]|uniref:Transposase DDE domain-containing protein n=2 Tax=root TaxID=1 RepID=A0A644UK90_9ZZZZ
MITMFAPWGSILPLWVRLMERQLADILPNHIATGQQGMKDAHFGLDKFTMDFAFFAIAFNIKKMCAKAAKGISKGFYNTKITLKTAFYEVINDQYRIVRKINPKWAA